MEKKSWLTNGSLHGLLNTDNINGLTLIIFTIISIGQTCWPLVDHD